MKFIIESEQFNENTIMPVSMTCFPPSFLLDQGSLKLIRPKHGRGGEPIDESVEGLYCKRPIQCLTSSKILTPHPLSVRRVCPPPSFGAGGGHTRRAGKGGGGSLVRKTPDTALYSTYVSTLWMNQKGHGRRTLKTPTPNCRLYLSYLLGVVKQFCRF